MRFRAKGSLFLPTTGMSKTVVLHGYEYYGEDGMVMLRNLATGKVREISPWQALYVASELHKGFVAQKKRTQLLVAIDSQDQDAWDNALRQIYELAKEQAAIVKSRMDAATSARATRGRFTHLRRIKKSS